MAIGFPVQPVTRSLSPGNFSTCRDLRHRHTVPSVPVHDVRLHPRNVPWQWPADGVARYRSYYTARFRWVAFQGLAVLARLAVVNVPVVPHPFHLPGTPYVWLAQRFYGALLRLAPAVP